MKVPDPAGGSCLAALAVAAAVLLVLPSAATAASKPGVPHDVPAQGSPLNLSRVALGQVDRTLQIDLTFARAVSARQLTAGAGQVCVTFEQAGRAPELCVDRAATGWRMRRDGAVLAQAVVTRPSASALRLRVAPADAGLAVGTLRWSVTAEPALCPSPTGGVPATPSCPSRAPAGAGTYAGRVWRAAVTGCSARGPAQVRHGPPVARVALTYDDGPSAYTAQLEAELHRLRVPATFFVLGPQVAGSAALLRRMLADGMELGNHSWSHASLQHGGEQATVGLLRTNRAIRQATGYEPCLFRPPFGATSADLVRRGRALGMTSVLWSVDPSDWLQPGTNTIVARVLAQTLPGAIILEHDGGAVRAQTVAAVSGIVAGLQARGYRFVTVSDLLGYRPVLALRG